MRKQEESDSWQVGKRALPSTESARCSLLGEAQGLAVGHSLRQTPKLLVEPDVAVQPGNRSGASEAFAIGTAPRLILQSAAKQVLTDPVEHPPKVVAGILVAASFEKCLRSNRRVLDVLITEPQGGRCERLRFRASQLACAEGFDAGGNGRNLVEDTEARFDDFFRRETGVTNRNLL